MGAQEGGAEQNHGWDNRYVQQSKMTTISSSIPYGRVLRDRDRGNIVQAWVEIWKGFKEVAAFDLALDRSPGSYNQMRRHFKQKQGGKEGVGCWHVTGGSVLGQKEGGVGIGKGPQSVGQGPTGTWKCLL